MGWTVQLNRSLLIVLSHHFIALSFLDTHAKIDRLSSSFSTPGRTRTYIIPLGTVIQLRCSGLENPDDTGVNHVIVSLMTTTPTDEEIITQVQNNNVYSNTLKALNKFNHGHYKWLHAQIKRLNLDTSHYLSPSEVGKIRHQQGKYIPQDKLSYEELFSENSKVYNGSTLRKRILKENLMEYKCASCDLTTWKNQPITLHIDHINGNHLDNRLENLRFLCPNCHSQTPTFGAKNKKEKTKKEHFCLDCSKKIHKDSKRCSSCAAQLKGPFANLHLNESELVNIVERIKQTSMSAVAKTFNVSDSALKKYLQRRKLI